MSASIKIDNNCRNSTCPMPEGKIKWNKLSKHDKFPRHQCVLEVLIVEIKSIFKSSVKGQDDIDVAFEGLIKAVQQVSESLPQTRYKNLKPHWDET